MAVLPLTATLIALTFQAFCLLISWDKADLHCEVTWIGWTLNFSNGMIKLQQSKRDKLLKLIAELVTHPRTSKKHIERFLGLALWVTELFPILRVFLHHL